MKKSFIILFLFINLLCSCERIPRNVVMTDPQTGKSVYIYHYSVGYGVMGIVGDLTARSQQRKAIEAAKTMGYTEMKEIK